MQTREVTFNIVDAVSRVQMRGSGLFQSMENREKVYGELLARGCSAKRSVVTGQQLHPEYVVDYEGTLETGFGNTQYQTYWSKLYSLDNVRC